VKISDGFKDFSFSIDKVLKTYRKWILTNVCRSYNQHN